jgi:hexokinase
MGGAIGAFIAFGTTYGKEASGTLSPSTYWGRSTVVQCSELLLTFAAFIAIMIVGAIIALSLAPPWLVVRSDGSRAGHNPKLAEERNETLKQNFVRIVKREFFSVLAIRHEKR